MLTTGEFMNQRYYVYDDKGNLATSYNLGLGSATALQWAKIACDTLEGQVMLVDTESTDEPKVIYQKKNSR